MNEAIPVEYAELADIVRERGKTGRSFTAIAGAPGSGKSTLAERLADKFNTEDSGSAAVLPMDGFHLDDLILIPRGWRDRKGAPHTFDVEGFASMLSRLRDGTEHEILVPVFDREIEIARNCARSIKASARHIIVEGNYLFLQRSPWSGLMDRFDTTVFLDVPMSTLRARLEQRWDHLAPPERAKKLDQNDIPNALLVLKESAQSEFVVSDEGTIA